MIAGEEMVLAPDTVLEGLPTFPWFGIGSGYSFWMRDGGQPLSVVLFADAEFLARAE